MDREANGHRTEVLDQSDVGALDRAVSLLREGAVIAVPTDTVYGLVCRCDREEAIASLYRVKERPPRKALPVLLGDHSQVESVVQPPLPRMALPLMERFWPGPLTIVLAARPTLPSLLTAGGATVGVRLPDHDFLREVARQAGPLASSSANRSGGENCSTADEVLGQLAGRIPLLVDGGSTSHAAPSTVVDLTHRPPRILRPGPLDDGVREILLCS